MKRSAFKLILILLLFSQCTKDQPLVPGLDEEGKIDGAIEDFGEANNALAFDLFHEVIRQNEEAGKNIVVSPLSIHTALLMVLNGANNATHEAIAKTLHSEAFSESSINSAYLAYNENALNTENTNLNIANSVFWDHNRIALHEAFAQKMDDFYDAELKGMAFQDPSALKTINDWVNTKTNGRIDKILEEIRPEEVLFLINALYFKGDWANPFSHELTHGRNFIKHDGSIREVPTMSHDTYFSFYQGQDYEAVDLIFEDSVFSMTFIQPTDSNATIDGFVGSFNRTDLEQLYQAKLTIGRLQLYLPRFETDYKINMNDALKALGMEIAFEPFKADLTRLGNAPEGNLYISRVEHKTYLKIDEKGAEGAAVTSVGVGITSVPPTIDFNRPFLFVLRDMRYNSVVFIGKIEDPLAE